MDRIAPPRTPVRPTLAIVVCVLGFMLATAFNSNLRALDARPHRASDLRRSDLAGFVAETEEQRRDLRERLRDLRARAATLERQAAEEGGARRSLTRDLQQARAAAGLAPVRGRGVEVILRDAEKAPAGADPNDYVIHDSDVSAFVNALFGGGAEAVSVNGERVVATTAVRCAGNTILVNATRLATPYRVLAIGEPTRLETAVRRDGATGPMFTEYPERFGIGIEIARRERLIVPAYTGAIKPVHLQPLEEGSEAK